MIIIVSRPMLVPMTTLKFTGAHPVYSDPIPTQSM
eukprot:CAMPEP_0177538480 /NCGR_PEP_ID=MMETSP0369-20130122/58409_1 /TAXON_ID=447022 ORGANISM="Scrippsiella hangoei-like, Strain SHHI-4" /NCGR_SAMPLE_ID=MMETSP0369 /ASSEMBLY_ACC=CAM_ASM_000364 /LENGTH=34 /DNA_ID= /DNA_START= /DNA_END= /DNA_ORIENTATION=